MERRLLGRKARRAWCAAGEKPGMCGKKCVRYGEPRSRIRDRGEWVLSAGRTRVSLTITATWLPRGASCPQRERGDPMDLNLVVIAGRLAATPEVRIFDGGGTVTRLLVTTKTDEPRRRVDVVPVTAWDTAEVPEGLERGDRVWVAGSVQRRFWSDDNSRRSRIEVVAHHVQVNPEIAAEALADMAETAP